MKEGIILLGHGSRRKEANEEIRQITELFKKNNNDKVYETAFLSNAKPDMEEAADILVSKGIEKIVMMPVFLVEGIHIKEDIPEVIEKLKNKYPNIEFLIAKHIGPHPSLVNIVQERIDEAAGS
ncbi:Sirohydrochlorin cobaltochelatase CbiX(small) [Candidatus Syntrophocurvum alkaliphilum]|uniref:Sirohydrochlorin cobaltochelatase CbiX(Small) n=1 Tax=Candidatus Syntrophocurvum alkaliphilum TaxID=2293317 RepID=A0A6I6DCB8_9FIRM|nr:CbiX/SirB N-terminal domain-containing protein [Candidatus Syntrophocurvum alkaliphilum]QGU00246.1 Sirohydrochlorin cobaltochelatase CbiX(small) [Candidatus Syntrophocurvum alkaliphilum]